MTYFHLGNCLALAYGPYILTYKYFELSEYGAFWKCAQVGGMFLLTELCKMLLLATFFPADLPTFGGSSLFTEFFKATVDFGDLIGLSLVLKKISATGLIKVLIAGLGWSTGDFILSRALPLWVGARGTQFDWQYIITSLEANVVLIHHLSLASLVFLWLRTESGAPTRPLMVVLSICSIYRPLLPVLYTTLLGAAAPTGFTMLLATALPTLLLASSSLVMLLQHTH